MGPRLMPLGDGALLVRFADKIDDAASTAVISFARAVEAAKLPGVLEIVPNLVSVLIRYDPLVTRFTDLSGELSLLLSHAADVTVEGTSHSVVVTFGGDDGPDLEEAAKLLGLEVDAFIARHNAQPLRVLATGFAPGFVYCGLHEKSMTLARQQSVRPNVPPGSVLFAAGQTAITSTAIPTGWYVIGRTEMVNFDAERTPPTRLRAGDRVTFEADS